MEHQATAKYIRRSTRKIRKVADLVRNTVVDEALDILSSVSYLAAGDIKKVLESAIANAKQKNVDTDKLFIKAIDVMGGPAMKRWRAVSRGKAHKYKKRMTHIKVVLEERTVKKEDDKHGTKS